MEKQWVKISDVLFFQEGPGVRNTQYTSEGVKLLNVANLVDGKVDFSTSDRYISEEEAYGKYKHFLCDDGDLIVASSGIKVEYFDKKMGFIDSSMLPLCMNTSTIRFKVLNPQKLEIRFFMYYLKSNSFKEQLARHITGSAQLNYGPSHLNKMIMPLVTLEKQKEIIKKLDKIQTIIEIRQQELQKLDELVKSRFIELFGDPKLNPRKWDMVTIGDIATDVRYGTSRPATEGGKYPYLRMNNLTYEGYLDLTDLKHIDIPDNEIEKCVVRNGDVLFNRTNSVELVGKTCVYNLDYDMIIAGYIIRVRIDDRVLPVILSSYLNSTVMKEQLRSMAKGAVNQANINAQELRSIPIYLPPITLQHEFATFVEQVDKSKFAVQQALDKAQLLFDSLMQKYFW